MSAVSPPNSTAGKGKGKANASSPEDNECTPLLASHSGTSRPEDDQISALGRRRLRSKLIRVYLISLAVSSVFLVTLAVFAYLYAARASTISTDDILDRALVVGGIDRLDVLNDTGDGGIWLEIEGRIGLNAGGLIGVNAEDDDGLLLAPMKAIGRWGVHAMKSVSVELDTVRLTSDEDRELFVADVPPLQLPLTTNPPSDTSWLTRISIPLLIRPSQNTTNILEFLRDSWSHGKFSLRTTVRQASVRGGDLDDRTWRRTFSIQRSDIETTVRLPIPSLPGWPPPGPNSPFPDIAKLVTVQSYGVSHHSDYLTLYVEATTVNPFPKTFSFTTPNIPFLVSIPSLDSHSPAIPVATVHNEAFALSHPNISLSIRGELSPMPSSAAPVLSSFVSRFLSSQDNPIELSTPIFPGNTFKGLVPSPHPPPNLLRNVTIHDMRIRTTVSGAFLASGTVFARVVLPKGIDVDATVRRVWPDVLVFDGPPPGNTGNGDDGDNDSGGDDDNSERVYERRRSHEDPPSVPPADPLPDPLPKRAFARLRPDDWVLSESMQDVPDGEDEGLVYVVTARVSDVPLEVLPGRAKDFRNFVTKVIFGKQGALAGIKGTVAVSVDVPGLTSGDDGHEIELVGLPFHGIVRVGKGTMPSTRPWWG